MPEAESYFLGNSLGPLTHAARAAVVRTLDDAAAAKLAASAENYVANSRRFARGLKKVG